MITGRFLKTVFLCRTQNDSKKGTGTSQRTAASLFHAVLVVRHAFNAVPVFVVRHANMSTTSLRRH
jgi:hypothetical protein